MSEKLPEITPGISYRNMMIKIERSMLIEGEFDEPIKVTATQIRSIQDSIKRRLLKDWIGFPPLEMKL